MGRNAKPPDQRVRRAKPEQWHILPAGGCQLPAPKWPFGKKPTKAEESYWAEVWSLPIAAWWHEQEISPYVIARYVRSFCQDAANPMLKLGATVSRMERDLGLHPEALAKLRLIVADEAEAAQRTATKSEHWGHLRVVDGS